MSSSGMSTFPARLSRAAAMAYTKAKTTDSNSPANIRANDRTA
jgi:hypothetical protein